MFLFWSLDFTDKSWSRWEALMKWNSNGSFPFHKVWWIAKNTAQTKETKEKLQVNKAILEIFKSNLNFLKKYSSMDLGICHLSLN